MRLQFLLCLAVAAPAAADPLPVERAFATPAINGITAQGVQLSPDGRSVSWLKPATDDAKAAVLWAMPATGGPAQMIVDSRALGSAAEGLSEARMKFLERRHSVAGDAFNYLWSSDGSQVLVTFNGDLFLVPASGGPPRRLTTTEADESDAQLAPGNRHVAFLRGADLVIRALADGRETMVAEDAGGAISYGAAEFVAQEEMQRFTGAWWSPDGSRIAYTRVDESRVQLVPRVRIAPTAVSVVDERFPLTGAANAEVTLFVRRLDGGAPVKVDLGPDSDIYLYNVAWSRDGGTLYALRQTRDQKRLDLLAVDPASGAARVLVSETSATWVDLERDFRPLADGSFLWGSTRTGWRHIYRYDRDGALIGAVTAGAWRVAGGGPGMPSDFSSIVGVDEYRGDLYFAASIDTPVEQQLYRISYRRADAPHRITAGAGWWLPSMATRPTAFVARYSDTLTPPQTALYGLDGKRRAWLAENRLDAAHPMFAYRDQRPGYEYGTLKATNGADMHYVLARPAGFDPARRYPAIVRVYGGPGVQTVKREWRGIADQLYTQAGYVVFQLDNRGTSNRDDAFEHSGAGQLGSVHTADQLAGVNFLRGLPFIDPARVGMTGWSFGGYITVRALATPGSGIAAGAAGGVPADFALYDTHYTERFLGTPKANPDGYAANALVPRMKALDGKLLLAHGLSDDNVVIANFTALTAELETQGKLFETAVYPGQSHAIRGEKPLTHLTRTFIDFFDRRLKPQGDRTVAVSRTGQPTATGNVP